MSAATLSTSSKRSRSYRLSVNPSPVRAMAASVSLQRARSRVNGAGPRRSASLRPSSTRRSRQSRHGVQHGPLDLGAVERVGDQAPVGAPARRTCRRRPRRASARWRGGCRGRARPAPWRCGAARRCGSAPAPRSPSTSLDSSSWNVTDGGPAGAACSRPAPAVRAGPLGQAGLDRQLAGERPPEVLDDRLPRRRRPAAGTTRNCDAAIAGPPSSPEYAHAVSTSRPRSDSTPAMRANAPGHVVAHDRDRARCRPSPSARRRRPCARRTGRRPSSPASPRRGSAAGAVAAWRVAVEHAGACGRRGRRRAAPSTSPTPTGRSPASRPR